MSPILGVEERGVLFGCVVTVIGREGRGIGATGCGL